MPSTYSLIASTTLGSTSSDVTFTAIPSTFTDLVLRLSIRRTNNGVSLYTLMRLNGLTTTIYSTTMLNGSGSAASSNRLSSNDYATTGWTSGNDATANTFGSTEIYIPNYTGTVAKPIGSFGVAESNATAVDMLVAANLVNLTSAVSSIQFNVLGLPYAAGSSFYLYGIKNS